MSFWNSYSKPYTDKRFESIQSRIPPPPTTLSILVAEQEHIPELTEFLTKYFGDRKHPTLHPVLNKNDLILYTRTKEDRQIQATIRYKYAGKFENQPIYLIDCFCSKERKTGIASQLLSALHTRTEHIPYALFLKEGRPVPGQEPLYSSHYVFRRTHQNSLSPLCFSLSRRQAFVLVEAYRSIYRNMFWLGSESNPNQSWRLWKNTENSLWALACFQDSFQETGGERIGWMTAYIGNCDEGLEYVVDSSPYPLVWADRVWVRNLDRWMADGPFHWYSYRWTTGLLPAAGSTRGCYGIVV